MLFHVVEYKVKKLIFRNMRYVPDFHSAPHICQYTYFVILRTCILLMVQ